MFRKSKKLLPPHPRKHHKPFRWRHVAIFAAGLLFGALATYRSGYITEPRFDISSVSPATVKIYHYICGQLVLNDQKLGNDVCDGNIGTGFLISSDGLIATSGHVVDRGPADIFVQELRTNPALLQQYAQQHGLSQRDVFSPDMVNKLLTKVYELPRDQLKLTNRQEITLVSLGDRPVEALSQPKIRALFSKPDTDYIKTAQIMAMDYEAKDILVIEQQQNSEGFSASDMAILKIDVSNAPFIKLADTTGLRQSDAVNLIGFPSDAENQLTANNTIVPSVTTGTVNSIRAAKGSSSRLLQTDADASQGSSGGPAVNDKGEAIGVVTYRYKDKVEANAAKSYIRDIADLRNLLNEKVLGLNTASQTQQSWEQGLELASQNKFSSAVDKYQQVLKRYPAHRLANIYGNQALEQIKAGKDVKEVNYWAITAGLGASGLVAVAGSSALALRHHRYHRHYKSIHHRQKHIISPTK